MLCGTHKPQRQRAHALRPCNASVCMACMYVSMYVWGRSDVQHNYTALILHSSRYAMHDCARRKKGNLRVNTSTRRGSRCARTLGAKTKRCSQAVTEQVACSTKHARCVARSQHEMHNWSVAVVSPHACPPNCLAQQRHVCSKCMPCACLPCHPHATTHAKGRSSSAGVSETYARENKKGREKDHRACALNS